MNTFQLAGQTFTEGDKLTITTPELGTLIATTTIQPFSNGKVIGLELTPLLFVFNCTAKLSLYSNGQAYHTMQLAYLCGCARNVHRRYLEWFDLIIEGDTIRAGTARPEKSLAPLTIPEAKPAPVVEPVIKPLHEVPVETAKVAPLPTKKPRPVKPDPGQKVGNHGQFTLF